MDITVIAESVKVEMSSSRKVYIEIENIDIEELFNHISITDCINHFGADKILNDIGEDECKEHFGLVNEE